MTGCVIIISRAGAKYAVRVVPSGYDDRDCALPSYSAACAYAAELRETLGESRLDDRCAGYLK